MKTLLVKRAKRRVLTDSIIKQGLLVALSVFSIGAADALFQSSDARHRVVFNYRRDPLVLAAHGTQLRRYVDSA